MNFDYLDLDQRAAGRQTGVTTKSSWYMHRLGQVLRS
jgi:hypothetical protein